MTAAATPVIYEFGTFRLDAGRRLLFAKARSEPLAGAPKVIEALLYFVERPGELLEKEQLLNALWPGLVVEENSLTQLISALRRVLGEARGENRYLATVPGRGYRFVAPVVRVPAGLEGAHAVSGTPAARTPSPASTRPLRVALVGLAAALTVVALSYGWRIWWADSTSAPQVAAAPALPARTVAVLPFENFGDDPATDYLASGITEGLLHRLATVRELTLVARTSSAAFRDRPADARDIGRALNARYLVEGSVQRADELLRVTVQLVDASTGGHVWSLRFDRRIDDIFAVEDEIALRLSEALQVSLAEPAHPHARFGTEAYLAFLQGRALIASRRIDDAERALEMFSRAVQLAPEFAAAIAALADAHRHLAYLHEDRADARELMANAYRMATPLLEKALRLDDSLGEAYVLRADRKAFEGDLAGAEADYRHGLALSPNYGVGHEHFAEFLEGQSGRVDEALAEYDRARRIDPLTPRNHYRKGLTLMLTGQAGQAEALFLQSLQVAPDFHPALMRLAQMRWGQGQFAEAVKLGERAVAIDPRAQWMRWFLVDFYLEVGDVDAARSVLAEEQQPADPTRWLSVCLYQGQHERAAGIARSRRDGGWLGDFDLVAYALRDVARGRGDLQRARSDLQALRLDMGAPRDLDGFRLATLAHVAHLLGEERSAAEIAREILEPASSRFSHPNAVAYVILGQQDRAVAELARGLAEGRRDGWWYTFEREPAFAQLRSEPQFQALAVEALAHAQAQRAALETMRARGEVPSRPAVARDNEGC